MKRFTKTLACRFCGMAGLQWGETSDGYRMFETSSNGDGTVSIDITRKHTCGHASSSARIEGTGAVTGEESSAPVSVASSSLIKPPNAPRKQSGMLSGMLGVTAAWFDVLEALLAADARRILIAGPPGTGKTTTSVNLLKSKYRLTMTEGTGVEDMLGCFQLRKENPEDKTAVTIWADGPVPRAMSEGKGLLIDEVDKMGPEIQSLAYAVLDDHPEIMLPTGDVVTAVPGYRVLCTTNANIAVLPEAIIDRFDAALVAVQPHPAALEDMPPAERGACVNYFRSVSPESWLWSGKPTVRRMRSFVNLKKAGTMTDELAALCVFGRAGAEILSALTTAGR